jgi:hypothetical protein
LLAELSLYSVQIFTASPHVRICGGPRQPSALRSVFFRCVDGLYLLCRCPREAEHLLKMKQVMRVWWWMWTALPLHKVSTHRLCRPAYCVYVCVCVCNFISFGINVLNALTVRVNQCGMQSYVDVLTLSQGCTDL